MQGMIWGIASEKFYAPVKLRFTSVKIYAVEVVELLFSMIFKNSIEFCNILQSLTNGFQIVKKASASKKEEVFSNSSPCVWFD